jgi:formylglycine-generating enzyme required for sulfatase activity
MRCNSEESGRDKTTSVHAHPQGASPSGLLDMAGNVWGRTRSLWGKSLERPDYRYPYRSTDGRENPDAGREERRALRGGASLHNRGDARCASRARHPPDDSDEWLGFRAVVLTAS